MKRRSFYIPVLVLLALVLSASGVIAQSSIPQNVTSPQAMVGTGFTYQGQLKQGGSTFTASCDMAFRLYDSVTSGALVGSAITTTVPVINSLFTVRLDFGASVFTGDARWLDIQVRCPTGTGSWTQLAPRQALTPAPYALALPGLYTQQNAISPNLIGGYSGNWVTSGAKGVAIGGGGAASYLNRVTDDYDVVGGGSNNQAGDNAGTTTDSHHAIVGGGYSNTASATFATIAGGESNIASGNDAAVGGGNSNTASAWYTVIGGGRNNTASSSYSTVCGGQDNVASTYEKATVCGGQSNTASGYAATIPGGLSNSATMSYTLAAGRRAKANHSGAFVWADSTDANFASTANDQFLVRASGGLGINTNAPATNTLTVGGNGLRIGNNGTTLRQVEAGRAILGYGVSGVNVFTITFPTAFSNPPVVIATPESDSPGYNDVFSVMIRQVYTSTFVVNVYRIDTPGAAWGQTLKLNWYAGEQ
jgi:hypothetical protein